MIHPIHKVVEFEKIADYKLRVGFDDGSRQTIDFLPILAGELHGPLRDRSVFDQVIIDTEVHTLVWANGADFDPATLHDWPQHAEAFKALARSWESADARETQEAR